LKCPRKDFANIAALNNHTDRSTAVNVRDVYGSMIITAFGLVDVLVN